ncbi:MAG: CpaF family protein [Firmicutes bacterium]|nr:CpaF family protein [Bacillota bacterium]
MINDTRDTKEYLRTIRQIINKRPGELTDREALTVIEQYVFGLPCTAGRTSRENGALIRKLFLMLRRELSILQPLADDPAITEIMVNGPRSIFVERNGHLEKADLFFDTEEELEELIRRIAAGVHREINELHPIVDARLSDGSRVNAVLGNIALNGPSLTIRKFPENRPMEMADLIRSGTIRTEGADLLQKLVRARYNCFISGGTSSGKTTLLNVLSRCIPSSERLVVIEDSAELRIDQIENLVRLECRSANVQGRGGVDMARLVRNSLRMRPDRIIVGEVRGSEVVHMIQAMNTGHDGSMSTGHANSVAGILKRLEAMFLEAADIPVEAIRSQIAEGIDIIVHMSRMRDGSRRVTEIAELDCVRDGRIRTNSLYRHDTGLTGNPLIHREKLEVWK